MYPSQTSLIPITVTLAQFVHDHGLSAFGLWYDKWYLGVPFRYIAEPFVPIVLAMMHRSIPFVPLFDLSIYFAILSVALGVLGWTLLSLYLTKTRRVSILLFWLLLILPWRLFSSLALSEVSVVLSKAVLPFVLLSYWRAMVYVGVESDDSAGQSKSSSMLIAKYQKVNTWARFILPVLVTSLLLLINTSVIPILIAGVLSLALAVSHEPKERSHLTKRLVTSISIIFVSFLLVSFWYGISYWMTIFANPSLGGAQIDVVLRRIFDLVKAGLPLVAAVFSVYLARKVTNRIQAFTLVWAGTFAFLTIFRFISDYDFWTDWSSWFTELEVGIAFIGAVFIAHYKDTRRRLIKVPRILVTGIVTIPWIVTIYIYSVLGSPAILTREIPDGVSSLETIIEREVLENEYLSEAKVAKRVFVSGSTTFWLNSLTGFSQVRGGKNAIALHPYWDHAAYQIREGSDPELTKAWLRVLGVSDVLVHTPSSDEYYKDYRYIGKWSGESEFVDLKGDDDVYLSVKDGGIAYLVDYEEILQVSAPQKGDDLAALISYLDTRKGVLVIQDIDDGYEISVPRVTDEGVSVVITYHKDWHAYSESGEELSVERDPLGHILIKPHGTGKITLRFGG